jgi:hypothetical protein
MTTVHAVLGVAITVLFGAAGALGGWRWWRAQDSPGFWRALRLAQGLLVVQAVLGGALLLAGRRPDDKLHYLYGLLPLVVGFVAEQLRLAAADTVLAARGMESSASVAGLPEADQRALVRAVVNRELGVLALGAVVAFGLCVRAGLT